MKMEESILLPKKKTVGPGDFYFKGEIFCAYFEICQFHPHGRNWHLAEIGSVLFSLAHILYIIYFSANYRIQMFYIARYYINKN